MAKQAVGPIVRHLEKGVLAVTAAVFLAAVALFGVVSPNKVELESQPVGPTEVDIKVKEAADSLVARLQNATPTEPDIEDPIPPLQRLRVPVQAAEVSEQLSRTVPFGPPVPRVGGTDVGPGSIRLVDVVQLGKPTVMDGKASRSGVFLPIPEPFASSSNPQVGFEPDDVNWVTVWAPFDRKAQEEKCRLAGYDAARQQTIFLGVEVERRVQNVNGGYSAWGPVIPTAGRMAPEYPEIEVYEVQRKYNVSDEHRDRVKSFYDMVNTSENQLELIRPLFPDIAYGDNWRYPRDGDHNILLMDREYGQFRCRYPDCVLPGDEDAKKGLLVEDLLSDANAAFEAQDLDRAKELAELAKEIGNRAAGIEADELLARIQEIADAANEDLKKAEVISSTDTQVLWAHDAGFGSLIGGRTYQYRMRALICNRYCGVPTLLADPKDAEAVALAGPWSEPSDPVTVGLDCVFFVKSARNEKVKVDIFKWVEGIWTKDSFELKVGDPIGGVGKAKTPSEPNGTDVDFFTGSTVVDVEFDRSYRSARGNKLAAVEQTTAVIYLDSAGRLRERLLDIDKSDPLYKELKGLVYKPPRN